jgi:hypothetical protein
MLILSLCEDSVFMTMYGFSIGHKREFYKIDSFPNKILLMHFKAGELYNT